MDIRLVGIAGVLSLGIASPAVARDTSGWNTAGGVARDALVVAALGLPVIKGDWHGGLEAGGSLVTAGVATWALKESFPERRPDGSDRKSFPSGHTSISFAAAATLQNRYGWKVGLPAQAVAAFVGFSRVEARKHHWYDVLAGAAIGEASGFLITSRRERSVRVFPWGDTKNVGAVAMVRF